MSLCNMASGQLRILGSCLLQLKTLENTPPLDSAKACSGGCLGGCCCPERACPCPPPGAPSRTATATWVYCCVDKSWRKLSLICCNCRTTSPCDAVNCIDSPPPPLHGGSSRSTASTTSTRWVHRFMASGSIRGWNTAHISVFVTSFRPITPGGTSTTNTHRGFEAQSSTPWSNCLPAALQRWVSRLSAANIPGAATSNTYPSVVKAAPARHAATKQLSNGCRHNSTSCQLLSGSTSLLRCLVNSGHCSQAIASF